MWRSQLKAMLLSPSPHSFTTLHTRSSNSSRPRIFTLHKTLYFHSYTSFRFPTSLNFPSSSAFVVPIRCLSSVFLANTLEWNESVLCSEMGDADGEGRSLGEEDSRTSILVRAPKTKRKKIWVGKGKVEERVFAPKGEEEWRVLEALEKGKNLGRKGRERNKGFGTEKKKKSRWGHYEELERRTGYKERWH